MTAYKQTAVTKRGLPGLPVGNIKSGRSDPELPTPSGHLAALVCTFSTSECRNYRTNFGN